MLEALEGGGLVAYVVVFVAAATPVVEILLVIPAGIVAGLPAGPVALVALAGNVTTVAAVVLAGDRLRAALARRRARSGRPPRRGEGRAQRILDRWGTPGLALLAPISTGSHVGAMAALAFGTSRARVIAWMSAGLALWAGVVTVAALLGVEALLR